MVGAEGGGKMLAAIREYSDPDMAANAAGERRARVGVRAGVMDGVNDGVRTGVGPRDGVIAGVSGDGVISVIFWEAPLAGGSGNPRVW